MKPVCVRCERFLRCVKTGVYFVEGRPLVNGAVPGVDHPEQWGPYKLWAGDRYECDGCGYVILTGFGLSPISEHYKPDFADAVKDLNATLQVNDC